jgi:prophage regulatory protein
MPRTATAETTTHSGRTFLRLRHVLQKTGLASSSLYDFIEKGSFPKPVPLSQRRVAWLLDEVEAWMQARVDARAAGETTIPVKRRRRR